jgi:ATP-dependent DNA ligase
VRSCLLDGEAVACERDGMPSFDRLRYRRAERFSCPPATSSGDVAWRGEDHRKP